MLFGLDAVPCGWSLASEGDGGVTERFMADLEASRRLRPQIQELAQSIQADAASSAGSATGGTDPALAAITSLTSRMLPNAEKSLPGG